MIDMSHMDSAKKELTYHSIRASSSTTIQCVTESILRDMEVLDNKSVGLLQFISILLAALTFSLGLITDEMKYHQYFRAGIELFLIAFSGAAWINLRSLNILNPGILPKFDNTDEFNQYLIREIIKRRSSYISALMIVKASMIFVVIFTALAIYLRIRL